MILKNYSIYVNYRVFLKANLNCKYYWILAGSSTLPRATTRATDTDNRTDKVTAATSSTSLYDNVGTAGATTGQGKQNFML